MENEFYAGFLAETDLDTIIILGKRGFNFLGTNFPQYNPENAIILRCHIKELVESGQTSKFNNPAYGALQQEMRKDLIEVMEGSDYGRRSFRKGFDKSPEWYQVYFIPDLLRMDDPTKGGPNLCTWIRGMGEVIVMSFIRRSLGAEPYVKSNGVGIEKNEKLPEFMHNPEYPSILVPTSSITPPLHVIIKHKTGERREYFGRPGETPSETIMH
ncbi:MAG: hypothetical protein NT001_00830 [Candidatus Woesearchaeota archaeon]|nr:hypothetical protein [Candidatus Woesearchaeota archaeon]